MYGHVYVYTEYIRFMQARFKGRQIYNHYWNNHYIVQKLPKEGCVQTVVSTEAPSRL
jgi:hypothetical protein